MFKSPDQIALPIWESIESLELLDEEVDEGAYVWISKTVIVIEHGD